MLGLVAISKIAKEIQKKQKKNRTNQFIETGNAQESKLE